MVACNKKKPSANGRMWRTLAIVGLLLAALFLYVDNNISQMLLDLSYADAYAIAVETLHESVKEVLGANVSYEDLMNVRSDANGRITLLQANTTKLNELAIKTAASAQEKLYAQQDNTVAVPLGAALGIRSFAAAGPKINVHIVPVGTVVASFTSDFESAGINQTRHRIIVHLNATIRLVIPTGAQRVDVATEINVAESIIVGEVPDQFVDLGGRQQILNLVP